MLLLTDQNLFEGPNILTVFYLAKLKLSWYYFKLVNEVTKDTKCGCDKQRKDWGRTVFNMNLKINKNYNAIYQGRNNDLELFGVRKTRFRGTRSQTSFPFLSRR